MLKFTYISNLEDTKEFLQKVLDISKEYPFVITEEAGGNGFILGNKRITLTEEEIIAIMKTFQKLGPNETKTIRVGPKGEEIRFTVEHP